MGTKVVWWTLGIMQAYNLSDEDDIIYSSAVTPARLTVQNLPDDQNRDAVADQATELAEQFERCLRELRAARREIENHVAYCRSEGLPFDRSVMASLVDAARRAERRIKGRLSTIAAYAADNTANLISTDERALRFGLATLAYVRGAAEWCAQSYAQSESVQFFDTRAQDSPTVNYERYENQSVKRVERQLLNVLNFNEDAQEISVTSSGMAAFTLIESFLVRDRLQPGDTILLAPYIYFESSEQLTSLPFVRVEWARGYGVDDIVADVLRYRPRCIFVDQVANTAQQRMIDLAGLFQRLRAVVTERTTVVVDGTMTAAALSADLLASDSKLEILYYESCSKYLQFGLDAGMAGFVAFPKELYPRFERLRRNAGLILYRHSAELFPRYSRSLIVKRMGRICHNAHRLATLLHTDRRVQAAGRIWHPGLPDHPDAPLANRLPRASGFATFLFHDAARNTREELNAAIDDILIHARQSGIQLTKGASFGFSAPRVSAADAMVDGEPPYLRIYAGDRGDHVEFLAESICRGLADQLAPEPADSLLLRQVTG